MVRGPGWHYNAGLSRPAEETILNFRSDNEAPVAGEILAAIAEANHGTAWSYAEDPWSGRLNERFSTLFGTKVTAFPLATGTAANSIALACVTPPWGSVYCHRSAHILTDEAGAPEFFGAGLRLVPVEGADGKMEPGTLLESLRRTEGHGVHSYQPAALSITNSTEAGTVYTPEEVADLAQVARERGLTLHMDGARFANAVVSIGCSPAELTWKAGVKMLSFGASKNGCLAAEALLVFGEFDWQLRAEYLRKRSGHLLSKMRYVSAQLLRYVDGDLWLDFAGNANRQAARFAFAIGAHPSAALEHPVQANEVFLRWSDAGFRALEAAGVEFFRWPGRDDLARFVFAYHTTDADTERLCGILDSIRD